MNQKEIRRLFKNSRIDIDEERKKQTFRLLEGEIARKKIVPQMSFYETVRVWLGFVEWRILLSQLICILVFALLYVRSGLQWPHTAPFVLAGAASAFSGMLLVLACSREEAAGIAELAASCYFNHRQLAALHLILCGGLQLVFLAVSAVLLRGHMEAGLAETGLYLLVPYLLTGCVEFAVLLAGFGRRSNFPLLAGGCVMAVISGSVASCPEVYRPAAMGVWIAVFVVCAAVYAAELAAVLRRMEYAGQYV